MTRRRSLIAVGVVLVGPLAIALLVYGLATTSTPAAPRPPELGGQQVPNAVYEIRFDRRYDLYCSFFGEERTLYRDCQILGFTGSEDASRTSGRAVGVFSGPSSGSSSYYREYFNHWLVLKLSDGRLAYIPPGAVKYIEEASAGVE